MDPQPIAVCTFFSKTTCGYCKQFKGEITDEKTGIIRIDPDSGWETLTSDLDLQGLGVAFNLYQFGPEKDPRTGRELNYVLAAPYSDRGRMHGVPHLELQIPGDPTKYVSFDTAGMASWETVHSLPAIKRWILATLQTELFVSYKADVRAGKVPSQKTTEPPSQPRVPPRQGQMPSPLPAQTSSGQHLPPTFMHQPPQQVQASQPQEPRVEKSVPPRRTTPTTFGMGTEQIKPVATTTTIPINPSRQKAVEKPRPRFAPANFDE